MTSFAFVAGLYPLVVAKGAGAVGNNTIGTSALGGMVMGTLFGVLLIPGLYFIFGHVARFESFLRMGSADPSEAPHVAEVVEDGLSEHSGEEVIALPPQPEPEPEPALEPELARSAQAVEAEAEAVDVEAEAEAVDVDVVAEAPPAERPVLAEADRPEASAVAETPSGSDEPVKEESGE